MGGRRCSICTHSAHEEIDAALVRGESNRRIAARYGLSETSIRRHKAEHLPAAIVKAEEAREVARADDLLADLRSLQERTLSILTRAETAGDLQVALRAIREARGNTETLLKILTTGLLVEMERKQREIEEAVQAARRQVFTLQGQDLIEVVDAEIERLEQELGSET